MLPTSASFNASSQSPRVSCFNLPRSNHFKSAAAKFIHLLLEYRGLAKLWGTYVNGIGTRLYHNKIFPNISLHTTVTGRTSSKDPNMQNIPRGEKIKRMFVPASGNVFVQCDYRAAELRVLGVLAQDEYFKSVLNDPNRDVHSEVALEFYGSNFTKDQRVNCKKVVFGTGYGAEAPRIAQLLGVSLIRARQFQDRYFKMIPNVVAWQQEVKDKILAGEDLVTFTGRRRRHWLISNANKKDIVKEGLAFLPQSTASDLCLISANALRLIYGLHVKMTVHDSILVECKDGEQQEVSDLMQQVMFDIPKERFSDYIDFTTEVKIGNNWAVV